MPDRDGFLPWGFEFFGLVMKKNDEVTVTIEDLGFQGEGIGRVGPLTLFVPFALPGEKVRAKVLHVKKNLAFAKLEDVLTPAEERVRPECGVFGKCGGCQFQHLRYSYQLRFKSETVKRCFQKIARLNPEVSPTVRSENPYGYRNKLQIPVGFSKGRTVIGFYAPNSHRIVETSACALQPAWSERMIKTLRKFMEENHLRGYDETDGSGDIRHIIVRDVAGKLLVTVVVNGKKFAFRKELCEAFSREFDPLGLYINFNDADTNVVTGKEFEHLYGLKTVEAVSHGMKYQIHPASFYQVNDAIRERIYTKIQQLVSESGCRAVVDAYSGAGVLTAILTKTGCDCYGIEIVPEATANAEYVRCANCLFDSMHNINGDCAEKLPELVEMLARQGKRTAVILDPPRKGCERNVLEAIKKCEIPCVIYLSCNPATLARDIGILLGTCHSDGSPKPAEEIDSDALDYRISLVQPYDMFPNTKHIETLVCLEWKNHNI